jgi:hypothetical protein
MINSNDKWKTAIENNENYIDTQVFNDWAATVNEAEALVTFGNIEEAVGKVVTKSDDLKKSLIGDGADNKGVIGGLKDLHEEIKQKIDN